MTCIRPHRQLRAEGGLVPRSSESRSRCLSAILGSYSPPALLIRKGQGVEIYISGLEEFYKVGLGLAQSLPAALPLCWVTL